MTNRTKRFILMKSILIRNEKILEEVDKKTKELNDEAIEIHRKIQLLL